MEAKTEKKELNAEEIAMSVRLRDFRTAINLKQGDVAAAADTYQGQLSSMESAKRGIQLRVIRYYAVNHRLNVNWLLTGEGGMFNGTDAVNSELNETISQLKKDVESLKLAQNRLKN